MEVTFSTITGWYNDLRQIVTYKTHKPEEGTSVTTVETRRFHVALYSADGSLEKDKHKGSNVDIKA